METSDQNILQKFKALPPEVRDAITSVDTTNSLRGIGEKYKLNIEKIGFLADETGAVMLGMVHPTKFTSNLKVKLGVSDETVKAIAEDVNVQIFRPIRESLKKIHGIDENGEASPPASNTLKAPATYPVNEASFSPFQPPSIVRGQGEENLATSKTTGAFGAEAEKAVEDLRKNAMQQSEVITMPKETAGETTKTAPLSPTPKIPVAPNIAKTAEIPATDDFAGGEEGLNLSRENIINEIENPKPAQGMSRNFLEEKMSGMARTPAEEKSAVFAPEPNDKPAVPPKPPLATPPVPAPKPTESKYKVDPYREPLK